MLGQASNQFLADVHVLPPGGDKQALPLKFQLDTGATCSTLTLADYHKLTDMPLRKSKARLKLYDNTYITPAGTVTVRCTANNLTKKIHFEVLDNALRCRIFFLFL